MTKEEAEKIVEHLEFVDYPTNEAGDIYLEGAYSKKEFEAILTLWEKGTSHRLRMMESLNGRVKHGE